MNISETYIRRPIATSLMMLGLLVFGAATYNLLPVSALPNVDFPTITVTASLPGASPETMASSVATPLEQQFAAIPGLASMSSTSGLGSTSITLQFDLNRKIDGAATDVQTAINAASGLLPKDLPNPPTYRKVNPADRAVLIYAVYSEDLPPYKVDDYAYVLLAQKLSAVPGVSQVLVAGQQDYAVRIQANPVALASRGISLEDVRTAITNSTLNLAKGNLENDNLSIMLDTNDQLFQASAYNNIIVAYRNGAPVRLRDIGDVVDGIKSPRAGAWFNGKRAELLLIFRQPGANTVEIVDRIKGMMPRLLASVPQSVHVDLVSDRSQSIRDSVEDVQFTLILTIGLVVLVIFIFLRHLWATIIPSITVPLAIVGTFGIMYVCDYSIDNLSLMGLTIAVGFVVDDAIVMIENIVRYIEEGERPFEAALKGAGQIGFTIISITFSLIAVFIPLLFMGGIVGRLFREFAVVVTVAICMSAFVSLTLTPVMCAQFLKRHTNHKRGRLDQLCEDIFEGWVRLYDRGLQWVFRHQFITLMSTFALVGLTGYLYAVIPKGFFPEQDTGFIFGQAEARQDISFYAMAEIQKKIAAIVQQDPAVSGVVGFVGATGGNASENTARMFIQLKPFADRPGSSAQKVIQRLRPKVAQVPGVKFFMQAGQDISVGGRLSKTEFQYTITSTDSEELNHWAPIIEERMAKLPGLQDVTSDQQIASPHIAIEVDRDSAYRLGITLAQIDQTLYDAFGQRQIATIYSSATQYKVVLEVQPQFQNDPSALSQIYVTGMGGVQIPLSAVAHFSNRIAPLTVNHQGQFPAVTISFNLAPGVALGEAVEKIQALQTELKTPITLDGSFQGTAQAFQSSLASTPLLIAAAILAVYIVLGMLYESYVHPVTILSALPSAGVGALLMLMLFGYDLSVIALIGIILLIGIVKKNAIMMIDFAQEAERENGKTPMEAIHEACLLRFRPIMMTTFAAIGGGLPLAIGQGAGSELRRPLGIAIVGGLLVSQWLTLYTTPVIYLYFDRFGHWLSGKKRRPTGEMPATIPAISESPAEADTRAAD
ncbi:multidrug efflux pump [Enhydrobacter aerosaccus]|uniref:Multidrug efflux pump n=1 Tax=Enhydrobacter aerosaccus TaxID=225324 RepID=A0A1T4N4G2_9HYPH|nr:multidrug efflux RND transporter permease subunit [Enhydrobacter aerosaccus]SJZ73748.1 multidrug efflux pump [Enhydrobacter aerosaccus]